MARALNERGVECEIEPLLNIVPRIAAVDVGRAQAILLTSANGARALADATAERSVRILAVGEATAGAAAALGFANVESADGDVAALAALVRRRLDPGAGPLIHVAGSAVAGDLAGVLAQDGFTVRREVLYEAKAAAAIRPAIAAMLRDGMLDGAVFFSPRTASAFVSLVTAAGLAPSIRRVVGFFLSAAVADAAATLVWHEVCVSPRPQQDCLVELIVAYSRKQAADRKGRP